MAGFRLFVWYGNGEGVKLSAEDCPQEHFGVTWRRLGPHLEMLLHDMEKSEGGGVRRITVEARP
jgi:hypothetical protein